MFLVKTPTILHQFDDGLLWKISTTEKCLYFTFDDGPTPGVTDRVLDLLATYDAKATFFCLGKNAEAYPELYNRLIAEGHQVGNHSYNHPDGWKTSTFAYLRNTVRAGKNIQSSLFRPPYGRITPAQLKSIKTKFKVVMWHVLSGDFDPSQSRDECLANVVSNSVPGSIVVFHDSVKARDNMLFALEESLRLFTNDGYIFRAIS